jgi:DNA-binding GntR family transcriptional regulator
VTGTLPPSYQQVADDIATKITAGKYKVGDPIPSTARLTEQYPVSATTVRAAVAKLRADGLLVGHPGKGVYVQATPADVAAQQEDINQLSAEVAALRATVARHDVALIELYSRFGYPYPGQDSEDQETARDRLA